MENRNLYRAKRTNGGEWVEGHLICSFTGIHYIVKSFDHILNQLEIYEVDRSTVCQCTGLRDNTKTEEFPNGKLIWENDIIKKEAYTDYDNYANSEEYIGFVKYEDCAWVIETKRYAHMCTTRPIIESMAYSDDVKHFEVIGNIFDNPEMVKDIHAETECKKLGKQVQTERGLIYVEAEYQSAERAQMDGYRYAFHSEEYGDVYSKCSDDLGRYHTFALISGYC